MTQRLSFFLIGGILSLVIAMGISRFLYTPILPLMQNSFSFSNAIAGYLATSNYAGYLLGAILAGIISLRKYRTTFLRISLIINIISTAYMGLSYSVLLWHVIRFLSGVTSAFIFVLASSIVLDKLVAHEKTHWSGLFYGGVGIGIFFTGLITPTLNKFFTWEGIWIGFAIISGILALFVWFFLVSNDDMNMNKSKRYRIHHVPPPKWLPWLIVAYGLEGLGYIVTGTFIVSLSEETAAFGNNATSIWTIVGLAAIPSCIIWSSLAKKGGFVKTLFVAMVLQAIGIVLPVISITKTSLIMSALLFGATFMGITTLATTLVQQINPTNSNRMIGYLTAVYAIGQMIGPSIAGILSSRTGNFNTSLIGAAGVVVIGACILLTGLHYESHPQITIKRR